MKKLDFLLKSNKEIFQSALKNRIPNCDKIEIIKGLTDSDRDDVTDISHRDLLFRFLCNRHGSFEAISIILNKIGPLRNYAENTSFLKSVKNLNKASIAKINLLIDFYDKNKFPESDESIFNYLVICPQIVGYYKSKNKEKLAHHLYYRFKETCAKSNMSIYHRIRFYEMVCRKTKDPQVLYSIFKDVVQEKSIDAFKMRKDLFWCLLQNPNSSPELINHCFRLLSKRNLISVLEKIDRTRFFYRLNQKGFHILYYKVGFQSFRRLLGLLAQKDVVAVCRYDFPKSIQKSFERVLQTELKNKRRGFDMTRLKD